MNAAADLTLELAGAAQRRALSSVLAPDNEDAKGLLLSMTEGEKTIRIRAESSSLSTSVSTVQAILRDAALFQEVWLLSHGRDARGRRA